MFKSGYLLRSLKPGSGVLKILRYAIGEIALVVCGILVAVSLNNWNESLKEQQAVENSLEIVLEELKSDTASLNNILAVYARKEKRFNHILFDSLLSDSLPCPGCRLITNFRLFKVSQRGYYRLMEYNDLDYVKSDTVISQLLEFYSVIDRTLPLIRSSIEDDIFDVLKHWRDNYEWFYTIQTGNPNQEYYDYIKTSNDYKNRVAYQYIMIYQNYIPFLSNIRLNAIEFIDLLEQRKREKDE
ncbi:hypothetical protein HZR84_05265 [Hyphobacterium sp. CCMP332]|nr:hypothetical protein HZR84_05265 [Hyphobacterium sp. CCMP332]